MKGMERSFTDREYKRKMRRELFLEQMMDGLIPWDCLVEGISPYDPKLVRGEFTIRWRRYCGYIASNSPTI